MLSIEHILNTLKVKQNALPKAFYEMEHLQIEDKEKYDAFLRETSTLKQPDHVMDSLKKDGTMDSNVKKRYMDTCPTTVRSSNDEPVKLVKLIKTYDSISSILGSEVRTTYIHSKSNQSLAYRFLDSLFGIMDFAFWMHSYQEKEFIFSQWIKKLDEELIQKERYYEFNYAKNRNMKREHLQLALNQALTYKCEYDIFDTLIQYNVDMLHMSLIVLNIKNRNIDYTQSKVFHYKNIFNPLNPLGIVIYDNGLFYPLVKGETAKSSLYHYDNETDRDLMKQIYKYMNYNDFLIPHHKREVKSQEITLYHILGTNREGDAAIPHEFSAFREGAKKVDDFSNAKALGGAATFSMRPLEFSSLNGGDKKVDEVKETYYERDLEKLKTPLTRDEAMLPSHWDAPNVSGKLKLEELRNLCEKNHISIKKRSEKTNKEIYKSKSELMDDLRSNLKSPK